MGLLLIFSKLGVPQTIQRQKLEDLFRFTAEAFNAASPPLRGLSLEECLRQYALFTREQADNTLWKDDQAGVQARLFDSAAQFGRQIRTAFGVRKAEDVMEAGSLVYRLLKIEFQGKPAGDIAIKRCFFSAYYTPEVCRLISSLDAGLLAGLSAGGKLTFSQRITEGQSECRAHLEIPAQ